MKKRTIIFSLMAILVVLSLIFTSCGTGTTGTKPGKLTDPQEITLNLGGEVNTIDPNRASWSNERSVMMQCFDGLLAFKADLSLTPMVAKEIPTIANKGISADGKTYTFKLKTNVTWSDGTKVTAKDFEYSIKRIFSPENASDYTSFYFNIVGGEAYFSSSDKTAAEKTALKDAVGVEATNDYTLEIKLINPLPTFLNLMALWPTYPLRQDMIEQYGEKWAQPNATGAMPYYIGNGPFILKEWVQQDHYTFIRNENYWGTKPYLTKITFKEITDAVFALAAYKNNELDQSGVPGGTEKATMADPVLSKEIQRYAQLTTYGLQFNVTKPPFDNKALRQAFSCAIDRNAYVEAVRGGVGHATTSWIPPGMPGYDATLGQEYALNPTKAKQYLAQAFPDGKIPELKFQYATTGVNPITAQFLQEQLKTNLGVTLILEPMETKAFSALVNSKQFNSALYGWGADYPDPDNWLPQLFGTGAGNNKTGYSSKAFDDLCKKGLLELNETKRLQLWADAHKLLVADAPMVFFFNRETFCLHKPWVKGQVFTGMDGQIAGDMFLREVYIQK